MRRPIDQAGYLAGIARVCSQSARGNTVVGVAFFVADGYLMTCAHVVGKALQCSKKWQQISAEEILGQEVVLEFLREGLPWEVRAAKVIFWRFNANFPKSDNDIAVLKLPGKMPEGFQPLPLDARKDYADKAFKVVGFPRNVDIGVPASGRIEGDTYDPAGRVQVQGTDEQGYAIEPGFSGSPVWSPNCGNAIVGMTVARDQEREAAKVGFMLPVLRLKRALEQVDIESLIDILSPYAETKRTEIQRAYRAVVGDRLSHYPLSTQREPISALRDNLAHLASLPTPGETSTTSLHRFAAYLSLLESAFPESLTTQLKAWLALRIDELRMLLDDVREILAVGNDEKNQLPSPHLLVWVRVSPDYRSQGRYLIGAQLIRDPGHYDARSGVGGAALNSPKVFRDPNKGDTVALSDLEKIVQKCLVECSSHNLKELTLELFLPLNLLDTEAEHWSEQAIDELPPSFQEILGEPEDFLPVGVQYRVVLRMTERIEKNLAIRRGQWQAKWSDLLVAVERGQTAGETLTPGQNQNFKTIAAKADCLGMHLVAGLADKERQNRFVYLAYGAAPVALWLRRPVPKTRYRQHFNRLLTQPIGEIASTVREERRKAYEKFPKLKDRDRHFGHHLALIWENPYLVPPEAEDDNAVDMPLEMP